MGCWNETCMLSRTPIFSGDIVYAGLVAMRPAWDTTYPDGVFMPVAPLVKGRYDDYGRPECVEAPDEVLSIYAALKLEVEKDGAFTPVSLDDRDQGADGLMQVLFEVAGHKQAYLVDQRPGDIERRLPLFPIMILGRFWELAQRSVKKSDLWLDGPIKDSVSLRVRLPGQFAAAVREGKLDEKTIMIPHLKLQRFLEACRASWQPTSGSGSQDGLTPEMARLAKAVTAYRNELRKEWG